MIKLKKRLNGATFSFIFPMNKTQGKNMTLIAHYFVRRGSGTDETERDVVIPNQRLDRDGVRAALAVITSDTEASPNTRVTFEYHADSDTSSYQLCNVPRANLTPALRALPYTFPRQFCHPIRVSPRESAPRFTSSRTIHFGSFNITTINPLSEYNENTFPVLRLDGLNQAITGHIQITGEDEERHVYPFTLRQEANVIRLPRGIDPGTYAASLVFDEHDGVVEQRAELNLVVPEFPLSISHINIISGGRNDLLVLEFEASIQAPATLMFHFSSGSSTVAIQTQHGRHRYAIRLTPEQITARDHGTLEINYHGETEQIRTH